ncbi:hypothetical protein CRV03_02645 [Arcobacter sp. F155]|uniref:restriction endonuclease subunit S n=1 Tax=Arcobacter sp. F155 TaxID=2044512 RepID=UPI00100AA68D|nr:restriction endonuclease subunit S [Arcobacter sp. F155]RXJ77887.1 hypothetical protein CRV03_02645 [Arcobacter sp. F155]
MSKDITLLKDLCENFKKDIVDGPFGSNLKREHFVDEGIPVLKIQNIKPFLIIPKNLNFVTPEKYEELKRHSYKQGDIVMTKLGNPLGASAIVENIDDGLIVADTVRIRAEKIDTKYLCYHLNSPITQDLINSQQKGATRPRVKIANVRELPIYAPKKEKQKQIVKILDKAFEAIDKAKENIEKNIQNSKELFQSRLNEIFSQKGGDWEEKTLGEFYDVRDGTHESPKYQESGYPLITSKNLKFGKLNYDKIRYISEKDYVNINKRSKVNIGDILFAMIGTIGNPIVITDEPNYAIKNVALFRVDNTIDSSLFLKYYLDSSFVINKMQKEAKGSTQKFVGLGYLRSFPINKPKLNIQKEIVNELSVLEQETKKLEEKYQQKLENLEELKKSILQKAFSGELV